jgi:hypothetical protein
MVAIKRLAVIVLGATAGSERPSALQPTTFLIANLFMKKDFPALAVLGGLIIPIIKPFVRNPNRHEVD